MEYALSVVLFCTGLYGVIVKRDLIKVIIGIAVMGYALNLFLILIGFKMNSGIPIIESVSSQARYVDPVAQGMVLTAIILELAVLFLLAALSIKLFEKYGTFDINEIKKLKG